MNNVSTWIDTGNDRIAAELTKELEAHIHAAAKRLPTQADDQDLLGAYVREWTNYMTMIEYLPKPFQCVTRSKSQKMHPNTKKPLPCGHNPVKMVFVYLYSVDYILRFFRVCFFYGIDLFSPATSNVY